MFFLRSFEYLDIFLEPRDGDNIGTFLWRNATFAEMKPRILAFRLSSRLGEARVPAEVWSMLSLEFVLPLCLPSYE